MPKATKTQSFKFQAEIRQLLQILIHSLYTDREIFLRELVSNATDALNRIQFEMLTNELVQNPSAELAIHIDVDSAERTLTLRDSGIGMTREELVENLGTIAHSGAAAFLQSLADGQRPSDIIGQFGVGFYAVFMVADEVRVTSRSYQPGETAWTWASAGDDAYTVTPGEREERGTTIWIKLKDDAAEFAEPGRLEGIVHKHSDFVPFPIYIGERVVNRRQALWRQPAFEITDTAANAFYRELTLDPDPPLARIHLNTEVPVQLYALLFVPGDAQRAVFNPRQDFGLQLYVRKVLIQDYCKDLLPHFLRFVEGVVDSEDLPLNVSREMVQSSQIMGRIRAVLTRKVLDTLNDMAENTPERFRTFWDQFGPYIKEGVVTDAAARDKLVGLLRFHASDLAPDALTSLTEYVGRLPEGQSDIYYVLAQDVASAAASPHMDYFQAHGIAVLYFVDPLDSFMLPGLSEFDGHMLKNVDDPSLTLPATSPTDEDTVDVSAAVAPESLAALIERVRAVLAEGVADVRTTDRLVDSPLRLVAPEGAWDHEMDRVRRLMEQDFTVPPRIVELNPHHTLIRDLARLVSAGEREGTVDACITQLYENGLLVEGLHPKHASGHPSWVPLATWPDYPQAASRHVAAAQPAGNTSI